MTLGFRVPASALHFVIAIAMTLSLFVVRASYSLSHDPFAILAAEKRAHAALGTSDDHGHVHDEGDETERESGHVHGHDPADHSHETPGMVTKLTQALAPTGRAMFVPAFHRPSPAERWRLERPPKSPVLT